MDNLSPDLSHLLRGLLGICAFVGIAYLFSANRRAIDWRLVLGGLALQLIVGVLVLKVAPVRAAVEFVSGFFVQALGFTREGVRLVFGWLALEDRSPPIFAITVLPSIIFFSALTSLLYYLGVLQRIVHVFAWAISKTMKLSGAESLSAAANIFVGQTEAPLVIKPYLPTMTRSELLAVMVGGMATIAGGVMVVYITLLGGDSVEQQRIFAGHLLTASVMSAPAALLCAKILLPQTETVDRELVVNRERLGANVLDSICLGTTDGLKLAVNVGAMLIVFTAFVAMCNWMLARGPGEWTGLNGWLAATTDGAYDGLSLQLIFGLLGAPLAWLMGIESGNLMVAGQLLGEKTVLNEFYAYFTMNRLQADGTLTDERTRVILTYALCGFSNLVAIGIQIGGIGAIAPDRRSDLARLGWRALLGGSLACFLTACVAGMLL